MSFVSRLRFAVVAGCLSTAAMACGGAPAEKAQANVTDAHSVTAPAAKVTQRVFGITRWHMLAERGANAIVFDGSDAKGNVRYTLSVQVNTKKHTITFTSYGKNKSQLGSAVIDTKTHKVLSNSFGDAQGRVVALTQFLLADWKAHAQNVAYASWGAVLGGIAVGVISTAIVVVSAPVVVAGVTITGVVAGAVLGTATVIAGGYAIYDKITDDKANDARDAQIAQLQQQAQQAQANQPTTTVDGTTGNTTVSYPNGDKTVTAPDGSVVSKTTTNPDGSMVTVDNRAGTPAPPPPRRAPAATPAAIRARPLRRAPAAIPAVTRVRPRLRAPAAIPAVAAATRAPAAAATPAAAAVTTPAAAAATPAVAAVTPVAAAPTTRGTSAGRSRSARRPASAPARTTDT